MTWLFAMSLDPEEELVKATLLTHQGKVVHPAFAKAEAEVAPVAATVEKVAKPKAAPKAKAPAVKAEAAKEAAPIAAKPVRKTSKKAPAKAVKTSADGGEA